MFSQMCTPTSIFPTINSITIPKKVICEVFSNFDIAEKQQELRATSPYVWQDAEFPQDLLMKAMDSEMNSMKGHAVFEEVSTQNLTPEELENVIDARWVNKWKGLDVKCRLCAQRFTQLVEAADTIFDHESTTQPSCSSELDYHSRRRKHSISTRTYD